MLKKGLTILHLTLNLALWSLWMKEILNGQENKTVAAAVFVAFIRSFSVSFG
jgi:hypothetical protein